MWYVLWFVAAFFAVDVGVVARPAISITLHKGRTLTSKSLLDAAADVLYLREQVPLLPSSTASNRALSYLGKHVRFFGQKKSEVYGGQVLGYRDSEDGTGKLQVLVYDDLYPQKVVREHWIDTDQITGTLVYYQHPDLGREIEVDKMHSEVLKENIEGNGVITALYDNVPWVHGDDYRQAATVEHNGEKILIFANSFRIREQEIVQCASGC